MRDAGNKERRLVTDVAMFLGLLGVTQKLACRERMQKLRVWIIGPGGTKGCPQL